MEKRFGKIHSFQSFINEAYDNEEYEDDGEYDDHVIDYLNSGELSKEEYKEWIDSIPENISKFLNWMIHMWVQLKPKVSKDNIIYAVEIFQDYIDKGLIEGEDKNLFFMSFADLLDIIDSTNNKLPDGPERKKHREIIDSFYKIKGFSKN